MEEFKVPQSQYDFHMGLMEQIRKDTKGVEYIKTIPRALEAFITLGAVIDPVLYVADKLMRIGSFNASTVYSTEAENAIVLLQHMVAGPPEDEEDTEAWWNKVLEDVEGSFGNVISGMVPQKYVVDDTVPTEPVGASPELLDEEVGSGEATD